MEKITLTRPDDWHLHVRSGAMLKTVIAHTAAQFGRAIIMPNLKPPITTVNDAEQYHRAILASLPPDSDFQPLMTLYLTDNLTEAEIQKAAEHPDIHAVKLYPAGATTNSDAGVSQLSAIYPILELLEKYDLPLLIHGEVTDPECDIFDRERIFIDTGLKQITRTFTQLRIVLEHITTQEAVEFVTDASQNIAATITPQHLMFNRNAILAGGIKPHYYCLPVIKREKHRQALVKAAISGNAKFFLGTDSAPHLQHLKENTCGCAGCYSAHAAMPLYAAVFEQNQALDKLEGFASFYGADFYRLPRNTKTLTLQKTPWTVPEWYDVETDRLIPLKANEVLNWQILD
jgi:dihydroorotase